MEQQKKSVLELAHDLQAVSAAGLYYCKNQFDREHFAEVQEIAAQLLSGETGLPVADVQALFERNDGYQTPKVSTRAAIFNERDEVLLVLDYDGKWAMPGGWCNYDLSPAANMVKEAREEAGLEVVTKRLVCIHDNHIHNGSTTYFHTQQFFFLCEVLGGAFVPNDETTDSGYFPLSALPELNTRKTSPEQIQLCLAAKRAQHWETVCD